jgi:CBS domain-containing protein
MAQWQVSDVMTTDVAAVRADTTFQQIAELIEARNVSALPVVDGGNVVVGVVTEADLLPKMEFAGSTERPRLFEGRRTRVAREKSSGAVARDLMTVPPVTAMAHTPVVEAAKRMRDAGVKRLPVVDFAGRLVGIVARRDLLKVYLRPDDEIRHELQGEFLRLPQKEWAQIGVEVDEGIVTLSGQLDRRSAIGAAVRRAERVDGVTGVISRLTYRRDDVEPVAVDIP